MCARVRSHVAEEPTQGGNGREGWSGRRTPTHTVPRRARMRAPRRFNIEVGVKQPSNSRGGAYTQP